MNQQTTSTILMIRPANFGFNPETATSNFYQHQDPRSPKEINRLAQIEFDGFVDLLMGKGVNVLVIEDLPEPAKSDAIFPNNWFSTHADGKLILYPMYSPTRRQERRKDIIEWLMNNGFRVNEIIDLTFFEKDQQFLEGTGSLILDRPNHVAYACKSDRTHLVPLEYFGRLMDFEVVDFNASQSIAGKIAPIYHTNVMMHVGTEMAVVCLESITMASERLKVQVYLEKTGKKLIPISAKQKFQFAGNMLEVKSKSGAKYTLMSETAYESLADAQRNSIRKFTDIIVPKIPTIERIGGGSVRCMMAEIFLPSV